MKVERKTSPHHEINQLSRSRRTQTKKTKKTGNQIHEDRPTQGKSEKILIALNRSST